MFSLTEIYRIVSSKALDQGEMQNPLGQGGRAKLELSESAHTDKKAGGCC